VKPSRPDEPGRDLRFPPGKFIVEDLPLSEVIKFAYNCRSDDQLLGVPSWANSESYDIEAKEDDLTAQTLQQLSPDEQQDQVRLMVQSLLRERFHLTVGRQTKQLPLYGLVIAKSGSKMQPAPPPPPGHPWGIVRGRFGKLQGIGACVDQLTMVLVMQTEVGGRVVLDETGLKGGYNWTLNWSHENPSSQPNREDGGNRAGGGQPVPVSAPPPGVSPPSLFTALEEQLGLKLVAQKGPVEVLVIDHLERPSAN
jgi:uncharacterized protein (TIGR03435 family)